jgi:Protein of unknown function (DUF1573)
MAQGNNTNQSQEQAGPVMTPDEQTHNFGKVPQGIPVKYEFTITNNGTEPMIIQNVQKTCGCTVTNWTKDPILPGQSGMVSAQYNAARVGKFKKPITVTSNASNSPMQLWFEGEVLAKDQMSGAPKNENSLKDSGNK